MKPDESRTHVKHRHEQDRAAPTVIHDPEQGMNLLERKLRHLMENQVQFWTLAIGIVVVLVGVSLLASGLPFGRVSSNEAWTKLESAKTAEEGEEIARDYPKTPAQRSAPLLVAAEYYMRGFADLPTNKDVALPLLKKALDRFQEVVDDSPADSPQALRRGARRGADARGALRARQGPRAVREGRSEPGLEGNRRGRRGRAARRAPEEARNGGLLQGSLQLQACRGDLASGQHHPPDAASGGLGPRVDPRPGFGHGRGHDPRPGRIDHVAHQAARPAARPAPAPDTGTEEGRDRRPYHRADPAGHEARAHAPLRALRAEGRDPGAKPLPTGGLPPDPFSPAK